MGRPRIKNRKCRYSDSCFTCPLPDCKCWAPLQVNCLPLDMEQENKRRKSNVKAVGIR